MPFQQDFILRQVHQLAQVLARVIFLRQSGQHDEALAELRAADLGGVDLKLVREMPLADLITLCSTRSGLSPDKAVSMADLLYQEFEMLDEDNEEAWHASGVRALWLYEAAVRARGILPADGHERMARLRQRLGSLSEGFDGPTEEKAEGRE